MNHETAKWWNNRRAAAKDLARAAAARASGKLTWNPCRTHEELTAQLAEFLERRQCPMCDGTISDPIPRPAQGDETARVTYYCTNVDDCGAEFSLCVEPSGRA